MSVFLKSTRILVPVCLVAVLCAAPAQGYIGPGAGVSVIGALGGLISILFLALWGLLRWFGGRLFSFGKKPNRGGGSEEVSVSKSLSESIDATAPSEPVKRTTNWKLCFAIAALIAIAGWSIGIREGIQNQVRAAHFSTQSFTGYRIELHTRPERFAASESGVRTYNASGAYNGLNIELSSMDNEARLLDMNGEELHSWSIDPADLIPYFQAEGKDHIFDLRGVYMRRVKPMRDGSLIVVLENFRTTPYGTALVKLDWNSNIIWVKADHYHHSVEIMPDGNILTLYQEISDETPDFTPFIETPFVDEGVVMLTPKGEELKRINIWQAFKGTRYVSHLNVLNFDDEAGDPYHVNIASYVTAEQAALFSFADEGDILVSLRNIHTIALIDGQTEKIKWAAGGHWIRQHEPVMTSKGTFLIFDNKGGEFNSTRIVDWNPVSQEFDWVEDEAGGLRLSSTVYGVVDELPNGNRLVSSSRSGRALEFDSQGNLVWEWRQHRRYGKNEDRISDLLEMLRLPSDYFDAGLMPSVSEAGGVQ